MPPRSLFAAQLLGILGIYQLVELLRADQALNPSYYIGK